MARIRTFKPAILTDSKTGTLSGPAFKLFLGMLNHSDDYGVIRLDVLEFKSLMLPYEPGEAVEVIIPLLEKEILARGLAQAFQFTERSLNVHGVFLHIVNFNKHQKVNRPQPPLLPKWDKGMNPSKYGAVIIQDSEIHGTFTECSLNVQCKEGKGKEGKGRTPLKPPRGQQRVLNEFQSAPFENFYQKYPLKKGKGAAERAWMKVDPDAGLLVAIDDAVIRQKAERMQNRASGAFVAPWKHPATWLGARCWEDEPDVEASHPSLLTEEDIEEAHRGEN